MKQRYHWERAREFGKTRWYLVPRHGGGEPIAAILPNDPDSRLLRYRARISFRSHGRQRDFDSAREARDWVEQTLADWAEWREDFEIRKPFAFSQRQRYVVTTIILGGALTAAAVLAIGAAIDNFWVAPTKVAAAPAAQHKAPDCRTFRPVYIRGSRSPYPPFSVWWQQSIAVVRISDDPPLQGEYQR